MNQFQLQVLGLICDGQINKQIADTLNVRVRKVMNAREAIYKKLGARNTATLVRAAVQKRLIEL